MILSTFIIGCAQKPKEFLCTNCETIYYSVEEKDTCAVKSGCPKFKERIVITKPVSKTEYFVGEDLDLTGLEVCVVYGDTSSVLVSDYECTGFSSYSPNESLKITINYNGLETYFYVKVINVEVEEIEITKSAVKTEYCIDEPLDTTGLEVTAIMNNGKREVISDWGAKFGVPIGDTNTVCITYRGKEVSYTVKIKHSYSWKKGEMLCQKCKNVNHWCEFPVDAETGADATSTSKYIYFGVFPKTVLPEGSTVTVDETDSVIMGANTYYKGSDGEYYAKVKEYAYGSGTQYKYSDDTQAKRSYENSYRYFKVEPIKWKVLTTNYNNKGKALLLAENILTANVPYYKYNSYKNTRIIGYDANIYPNNYKYSQIRAYLNGLDYYYDYDQSSTSKKTEYTGKGFLQTAFTATAQSKIAETVVDNSDASTTDAGNNLPKATTYACANTTDKIFLLSEKEVTTTAYDFDAYDTYEARTRIRFPTDYAKANYAYQMSRDDYGRTVYGGSWWLRSPYYDHSSNACSVSYAGHAYYFYDVSSAFIGVVPALSISL